jgi:hypothetical protein
MTTHGFLNQGMLMRRIDEGQAPDVLLKAIAVAASSFLDPAFCLPKPTIVDFANDIDTYIMKNLGVLCILNLQIVIIWTHHYHISRQMGKAWVFHAMSARLAFGLHINVERKSGTPQDRECIRRMMWSIRLLDWHFAGAVQEFSLCSKYLDQLNLPCAEHYYVSGMSVQTGTVGAFQYGEEIPNIGCFAALIGLTDIWSEILL